MAGLGELKPVVVRTALGDAHPGVRRYAIRFAERVLSDLGVSLLPLVSDGDRQVRKQLAYTLGNWRDPRAGSALGELAVGGDADPYLAAAVLSSATGANLSGIADVVLEHDRSAGLILELLRLADAVGAPDVAARLLAAVTRPQGGRYSAWQFGALAALLDARPGRIATLRPAAAAMFPAARAMAIDSAATPPDRAAAVPLLGRVSDRESEDAQQLESLLGPQTPEEVQSAAVAALARIGTADAPARLLRGWRGYGPGVRAQVLEVLSRRDGWIRAVLDAVEHKDLPAAEVNAARRQQWLRHRNPEIRARMEQLFGGAANPDRQKVIDAYASVLTLKGDAARGKPLFEKHCATCHKLGDKGGEVGPDLTGLADKPTDYLLTAILDPNRAIEPQYVAYTAELKNGQQITGVLAAESGNRVTLIAADGKRQTVMRAELVSLESTGRSAMPEGLEKDLSAQDLADVIAHFRHR